MAEWLVIGTTGIKVWFHFTEANMQKAKIDTLLILRGLLAVAVVIWHIRSYGAIRLSVLDVPGRTAVWFFFGISGYVISYGFFAGRYTYTMEGIKRFYFNRLLRIYPLFLLLSLVTLLTAYLLTGRSLIGLADIPSQFLLLQFNHAYVLNSVFWTLGIEVQFYLLAPLLALIFRIDGWYRYFLYVLIYGLFVVWVPFAYLNWDWSVDGRNLVSNLSHFFAGMIACKIVYDKKNPEINSYLLAALIPGMILLTNYLYLYAVKYYWTLGSVLIDVCVLLAVMLHSNMEKKNTESPGILLKAFTMLGVLSYGVYAWHPYLHIYLPFMKNHLVNAVSLSIATAYISYKLVEKPILALKRK